MARGRKGREISGWLVVDKPAGPTSTAVVAAVRRALGAQKAGHAGTLDPAATGVLAVALGEATKTVPHLAEAAKGYRFRVRWGVATATDDAEGAVLATSAARPGREAILAALPAFRGDILQVPPQVSAVKVAGARAYDLARAGVAMDLAPRPLHVAALELAGQPDADHADFILVCGKGGYVRAVARDLGARLGCLGHVLWLRREWSGPFRAGEGVALADLAALAAAGALEARLLPPEAALADMAMVEATGPGAARLACGNAGAVVAAPALPPGTPVWVRHEGRALALGTYADGVVVPRRVLRTPLTPPASSPEPDGSARPEGPPRR